MGDANGSNKLIEGTNLPGQNHVLKVIRLDEDSTLQEIPGAAREFYDFCEDLDMRRDHECNAVNTSAEKNEIKEKVL